MELSDSPEACTHFHMLVEWSESLTSDEKSKNVGQYFQKLSLTMRASLFGCPTRNILGLIFRGAEDPQLPLTSLWR